MPKKGDAPEQEGDFSVEEFDFERFRTKLIECERLFCNVHEILFSSTLSTSCCFNLLLPSEIERRREGNRWGWLGVDVDVVREK